MNGTDGGGGDDKEGGEGGKDESESQKDKQTTMKEEELAYFLNRPLSSITSPTCDRLYWTWRKSILSNLVHFGISSHLLQPSMTLRDVAMWGYASNLQFELLKKQLSLPAEGEPKQQQQQFVLSKQQRQEKKRQLAVEIVRSTLLHNLKGQCKDMHETAKIVLEDVSKNPIVFPSRHYDLFDVSGLENLTSGASAVASNAGAKGTKKDDRSSSGSIHLNVFDHLGKVFMDRPCGYTIDKSFTTSITPPWLFSYSSKPLLCLVDAGAVVSMFLKDLKSVVDLDRYAPLVNLVYAACRMEGSSEDRGDLINDVPPENIVFIDWSSKNTLEETAKAEQSMGQPDGVDPKRLERGKNLCMLALDVMGKTQHSCVIASLFCSWLADREWLDSKTIYEKAVEPEKPKETTVITHEGSDPIVITEEAKAKVIKLDDSFNAYAKEHPELLSNAVKTVTEGLDLDPKDGTEPMPQDQYLTQFEEIVKTQIEKYNVDSEETGREATETIVILGVMCSFRDKIESYYCNYQLMCQRLVSDFWNKHFLIPEEDISERFAPLDSRDANVRECALDLAKVFFHNLDPQKTDSELKEDPFYLNWMAYLFVCIVPKEAWNTFPKIEGPENEKETVYGPWWIESLVQEYINLFDSFNALNDSLKCLLENLGLYRAKYETIYVGCIAEQVSLVKVLLQTIRDSEPAVANEACKNYLSAFYHVPFAKEFEDFKERLKEAEEKKDGVPPRSTSTFPIKNMFPRAYCPTYLELVQFCVRFPVLFDAHGAFPYLKESYHPFNDYETDTVTIMWPFIPFQGEKLSAEEDYDNKLWFHSYTQSNLPFGGIERESLPPTETHPHGQVVANIKPIKIAYGSTDYSYFMNLTLSCCLGHINDKPESEQRLLDLVQCLEGAFSKLFTSFLYDESQSKRKAEKRKLMKGIDAMFKCGDGKLLPGTSNMRLIRFLTHFRALEQRCVKLISIRDKELEAGRSFDPCRDPTNSFLDSNEVLKILNKHVCSPVRLGVAESMKRVSVRPSDESPLVIPGLPDSDDFFLSNGWCSDFFLNVFGIRDSKEPHLKEANFILFLKSFLFDAKVAPSALQEKRRFLSKIASVRAGMKVAKPEPVSTDAAATTTTTTTTTETTTTT